MSYSKPMPPFTFDLLFYLNRDQLELFSIVCRPLRNLIDRYFHAKPHRVFDKLFIRGGSYALEHNDVQWYPNREDYTVQQFLAGRKCSIAESKDYYDLANNPTYYSFDEMCRYLGPTVRIEMTFIDIAGDSTYNAEHIAIMESKSYLWRNHKIWVSNGMKYGYRFGAEDLLLILNSPIILQCRELCMINPQFSFKDYNILYSLKVIATVYHDKDEIELWLPYWQQFLEQPGIKPIVFFLHLCRNSTNRVLDRLSKAFSSAASQNAFKIAFIKCKEPLSEFREVNKTSSETLELKKGLPVECHPGV